MAGYARSVGVWSSPFVDDRALSKPELLDGRRPRWLNMSRLGEILTDTAPEPLTPPVKAMVVWNCNPLVITPNAELIRRGVERDDLFTVVHDQFLTDTARYADIVLPATTQIEATDVVTSWGLLWIGWNEAAIAPLGESVSNSELHRRLAAAMGFTEPELFDDDLTALRAGLPDVDLDELRRTGWWRVPYPEDGRPFADGEFPTASGKVELLSEALVTMGQPGTADVRRAARVARRQPGAGSPLPVDAAHAEAAHPLPQLRLLAAAQARSARGRARSSSSAPTTPRHAVWRTASRRPSSTTGPASRCRFGSAPGSAPAWSRSRSAGGARSTPTGWWPTR